MIVLRNWLKKYLPNKKTIINHSSMNALNNYFRHPKIWSLTCSSASRGMAVGLFVAFIPLPLQMIIAALLAILIRANLPIAVVMTWITNPFTFVPINYFIYWVGKKVLGASVTDISVTAFTWRFESWSLFWSSLITQASQLGKAYFVGLPIVSIGMAALGYLIVRIAWYFSVSLSKYWQRKKRI